MLLGAETDVGKDAAAGVEKRMLVGVDREKGY
jgi:hypothetical protein